MKKLVILSICTLYFTTSFAQVPDSLQFSVFDRFGNVHQHSDLYFPDTVSLSGACSSTGLFEPIFTDLGSGVGFDDATYGADRRAVVCDVLSDLSDLIVAQSPCGDTAKLRIVISSAFIGPLSIDYELGKGSSFYDLPFGLNSGIIDGRVWLHINTGLDPMPDEPDGFIEINFDSSIVWNLADDSLPGIGEHDLYQIVLREMMHNLGFNSLINSDGTSMISDSTTFYSRFDKFLQYTDDSSNVFSLLTFDTLGNAEFNSAITTPTYATEGGCNHLAYNGIAVTGLPMYAPAAYVLGSSLSYLVANCDTSTTPDYLMNWNDSVLVRVPTVDEVHVLCDLGYTTTGNYGATSELPSCNETVAGIDDGIPGICSDTLIVVTDTVPTTISGFLTNDINAVTFSDLRLITPWLGNISSVTSTSFDFTISLNGTAVVTYIPIDAYGNEGNITHLIIYANGPCLPNGCHHIDMTGCNRICNSDLDANNSGVDFIACNNPYPTYATIPVWNWFSETNSTPDWATGYTPLNFIPYLVTPPTPVNPGFACMVAPLTVGSNYESNCEEINQKCLNLGPGNYILSFYEFNSGVDAPYSLDEFDARFYNGFLTTYNGDVYKMILPTQNKKVIQEFNVPQYNYPSPGNNGWKQYVGCVHTNQSYYNLVIYPKRTNAGNTKAMYVDQVELIEDNFVNRSYTINCGGSQTIGDLGLCKVTNMYYHWSTGETTEQITVSPSVTTTYTEYRDFYSTTPSWNGYAYGDVSCATTSKQFVVNVTPPTVTITNGGSLTFCSGGSVTLTANPSPAGSYNYNWSDGETINPVTVSPTTTTTYAVTVTNASASGCTATNSVTVTVNPNPTVTITGSTVICSGQTGVTLTANPGTYPTYHYSWSTAATTQVISNQPTGTYTVTVTNWSTGCSGTYTVTVTNSSLSATAGPDKTTCSGVGVVLQGAASGSSGYSYSWSPTTFLNNPAIAQPTASPTVATTYTLTVTDANGCTATDMVLVSIYTSPVAHAGNDKIETCLGTCVTLDGSGSSGTAPYTYLWSNGSTSATPCVAPTSNTTYTLTVTDANSCTATDQVVVTVNDACVPAGYNAGTDLWICPNTTASSLGLPFVGSAYNITGDYPMIVIEGTFEVDEDLDLNAETIKMMPCARIYVDPGYTLTLYSDDISAGCSYLWESITAADWTSTVNDWNTTIEDARFALYTDHGGVFNFVENSVIKNCAQGIHIGITNTDITNGLSYSGGTTYPGLFANATITMDNTLKSISSSCSSPDFNSLWVDGTTFMGAAIQLNMGTNADITFNIGNDYSAGYILHIKNFDQFGIRCTNANLNVVNTEFKLDYGSLTPGTGTSKAAEWGIFTNSTIASPNLRSAIIGGAGTYDPNTFDKMLVGINITGRYGGSISYNDFINNAAINGSGTAQAVFVESPWDDFHIVGNTIEDVSPPGTDNLDEDFGIHVDFGSTPHASVYIEDDNEIYLQRPATAGIDIESTQNSNTSYQYRVQNNYIRAGKVGILVSGLNTVVVNSNQVDLDKVAGSGSTNYCGIRVQASVDPTIQDNTVTRTATGGATGNTYFGIDIDDSWSSISLGTAYICHNTITDVNRSLNFDGSDVNAATILNNTFTDNYTGTSNNAIYVINGANIDDQGTSTTNNNNCFANQSGDLDAYAAGSGSNSDHAILYYETTAASCYQINNVNNDVAATPYTATPLTGSSHSSCQSLPYLTGSSENRVHSDSLPPLVVSAQRHILDTVLRGSSKWIQYNSIYHQFANNYDGQLGSQTIASFIDSLRNFPIGQFYVVDSMLNAAFDSSNLSLDTNKIAHALTLNDAIASTNEIEAVQKKVNNIYISKFLLESKDVDSTELSDLLDIAYQCPCEYGQAVFDARSMLYDLNLDGLNFSDVNCDCSVTLRKQKPDESKIVTLDFELYPNPAQNEVELNWDKSLESNDYRLELVNAIGSISETIKLPPYSTSELIDVSVLAEGIYFYRVMKFNSNVKNGKLVLIR